MRWFKFPFTKKQLTDSEYRANIKAENHNYWMNELQLLWRKDRQECISIRGRDIECTWVENHGNKQWIKNGLEMVSSNKTYMDNCDFMIRTRSGKEFSLKYEDWLKARFEDPEYKCNK